MLKEEEVQEQTLAYAALLSSARAGKKLTYADVADAVGFPMNGQQAGKRVGALVGAVSRVEHRQNRPMLSSIVVHSDGTIGGGFFTLATVLGRLPVDANDAAKAAFVKSEQARTFATWRPES